jgi:hypothetical protein
LNRAERILSGTTEISSAIIALFREASSKFADYLSPELLLAAYQKNPLLSDLQTDHFLVRQITGLFNPGICSVLVLGQDDYTLIQKHLNLPEPQKTQFIHTLNRYLPAQRNLLLNPDTAFPIISTRQGTEYFTSTGYNLRRKTHRLACGMKAAFSLTNI